MAVIEEWVVVGAGPERLTLADGRTVVLSKDSGPFSPAKNSHFEQLLKQGRLKSTRRRVEDEQTLDAEVESSSPEEEAEEPEVVEDQEEGLEEAPELMDGDPDGEEMDEDAEGDEPDEIRAFLVDDLNLLPRIKGALQSASITSVEDLLVFTEDELKAIDGIGEQSVEDIAQALSELENELVV